MACFTCSLLISSGDFGAPDSSPYDCGSKNIVKGTTNVQKHSFMLEIKQYIAACSILENTYTSEGHTNPDKTRSKKQHNMSTTRVIKELFAKSPDYWTLSNNFTVVHWLTSFEKVLDIQHHTFQPHMTTIWTTRLKSQEAFADFSVYT